MRRIHIALLMVVMAFASVSLSACGKKAKPADVPGGNYPIQYPNS